MLKSFYLILSLLLIVSLVSIEPVHGQFFTKAQSKSIPRMGRRSEESNDQTQSVESSSPDQLISSLKALDANNEINKSFVSSSSDHGSPNRWQLKEKTTNYNEHGIQNRRESDRPTFESPEFDLFYFINRRRR